MTQDVKPNSGSEVVGRIISFALIAAFVSFGGWTAVRKYLQREISHEKLTTVRYHGEWSLGEYRECNSMNLREEDTKPELDCIGSSMTVSEKVFDVSFSGDPTYDDEKPNGAVHYWLCRRNSTDPTFSCGANPNKPQASEEQVTPKPAEERQLTPDEIEYFRKRNECEDRFYGRKIYEVDGMSIGAACKQNPDRKP
jgi:hypothetical protein